MHMHVGGSAIHFFVIFIFFRWIKLWTEIFLMKLLMNVWFYSLMFLVYLGNVIEPQNLLMS